MLEKITQKDKLRTAVNRTRLIRIFLQLGLSLIFLFCCEPVFRFPFIVIIAVFTLYCAFYAFCSFARKHHILHSIGLAVPDIICTAAMLLTADTLLFVPFVFILSAELVIEKHRPAAVYMFTVLTAAALLSGVILSGDYSLLIYIPAVVAAQYGIVKILQVLDNNNKKKYEYMKKLVDNKNKLLSTLTHELRTPLAVIKTSNELIMEERPGPINETQRSLIHSSIENTKRLNALVENILSQAKVEFAWFSMKQQPLDIRNIIRKTAVDIKPYLDTKQQKLKYSYPSLLSKTIGDKRWLAQVLLNLIHNGSKNSPEGSVITIGVQENEQCIVVSVYDSGSGIENREIPHVFNEFYQSTDPSKNLNEGAGLGLTIVKDIIEKHRGEVYISSMPNAGTTVSFTLPLYKGVFTGTVNTDN